MKQNNMENREYLVNSVEFYYAYIITFIGRFLLIVPLTIVVVIAYFWKNFDFFWIGPFFAWMGLFLLSSLNDTKSRRKNLILLHLVYAGPIIAGICLYCGLLHWPLGPLEYSLPKSKSQVLLNRNLTQKNNRPQIEEIVLPPSRELKIEGGI